MYYAHVEEKRSESPGLSRMTNSLIFTYRGAIQPAFITQSNLGFGNGTITYDWKRTQGTMDQRNFDDWLQEHDRVLVNFLRKRNALSTADLKTF